MQMLLDTPDEFVVYKIIPEEQPHIPFDVSTNVEMQTQSSAINVRYVEVLQLRQAPEPLHVRQRIGQQNVLIIMFS